MKSLLLITIVAINLWSGNLWAKDECKQLKSCAEFVGLMTGTKYDLGKFEKKSIRLDPSFLMTNQNAEQVFVIILENNNLFRIANQTGGFRIVDKREFDSFQFPKVEGKNIRYTLDFVTYEYLVQVPELKTMLLSIAKKNISKNGRVLENVGDNKIILVDSGANMNKLVGILTELDK